MGDQTTRRSLLVRVRDTADDAAWTEFVDRYRELIRRFSLARGLQPSDADDICQLVFERLARALRSFEYDPARGRFRGYLFRIVRNEIIRHFARPERPRLGVDMSGLADAAAGDDRLAALWEREWEDHHIRLAMRTIQTTCDPASVAVFEALLAGASVEAAAGRFELTRDAVHKVKQRMRSRLETLIARQVAEEDDPERFATGADQIPPPP